jgi:hypothetical protein
MSAIERFTQRVIIINPNMSVSLVLSPLGYFNLKLLYLFKKCYILNLKKP